MAGAAIMAGGAQTAVVTGAGRGLGVALSAALRAEGYAVIEATRAAGLDLARPETFAAFAESLGGRPVDLVVHNAANRGDTGWLATLDVAEFEAVMRVNVLGPLLLTRALLANLRAGSGRVVMISSRAGSLAEGRSDEGDYAYKCSKAALNIAGLKLADETGLSVVALHFAPIETSYLMLLMKEFTIRGSMEYPERFADAIDLLARRDLSALVTDRFPLEQFDDALALLEGSKECGKVMISVDGSLA
jgi:NAD(P)-dependent dehydrogenase (short-subunit alcohol dehydrogenase family)